MNKTFDFEPVFVSLGGRLNFDEEGGYWVFCVGNFIIEAYPFVTENFSGFGSAVTHSGFKLSLQYSTSHKELSKLISHILGTNPDEPHQIKWEQQIKDIASLKEADETFRQMLNDKLTQVRLMNIDELVGEFAASCPDGPSGNQINHLAALAWKADFNTLIDYQETFERGFRLNFVPMIKQEMISRALEIAFERIC